MKPLSIPSNDVWNFGINVLVEVLFLYLYWPPQCPQEQPICKVENLALSLSPVNHCLPSPLPAQQREHLIVLLGDFIVSGWQYNSLIDSNNNHFNPLAY